MADEIAVRETRLEDIDGIMEIEHGSFATPWTKQDQIGELSNTAARYFVALEGEKVVAYAGHMAHHRRRAHHERRGAPGLARPGACGTRVLYALIQAAIDVGVQYMTLEVRVSNEPALALYKNFGFKKAGLRKKVLRGQRRGRAHHGQRPAAPGPGARPQGAPRACGAYGRDRNSGF